MENTTQFINRLINMSWDALEKEFPGKFFTTSPSDSFQETITKIAKNQRSLHTIFRSHAAESAKAEAPEVKTMTVSTHILTPEDLLDVNRSAHAMPIAFLHPVLKATIASMFPERTHVNISVPNLNTLHIIINGSKPMMFIVVTH